MRQFNKKSIVASFVLIGVLAMTFLLFMFIYNHQITSKYQEIEKLKICRQSTMLHSFRQSDFIEGLKGAEFPQETSGKGLNCPIIYKDIKTYDGTKEDTYKINKIVADELAGCWYKFNEGDVNLFAREKGEQIDYCAVCSIIKFSGSAKNKEIKGLSKLMSEKTTPRLISDKTYLGYLTGIATDHEMLGEIEKQISAQDLSELNTANDYVVMFYYPKKGYGTKEEYAVIGTAIAYGAKKVFDVAVTLIPKLRPLKFLTGKKFTVLTTTLGGWIGYKLGHDTPYEYAAIPLLIPYNEGLLSSLNCEQMPTPLGYRPS
ncbi:MAG: hypothetical protein ABIG89_04325 [Candidatus Woesearchaeota archaeon]